MRRKMNRPCQNLKLALTVCVCTCVCVSVCMYMCETMNNNNCHEKISKTEGKLEIAPNFMLRGNNNIVPKYCVGPNGEKAR